MHSSTCCRINSSFCTCIQVVFISSLAPCTYLVVTMTVGSHRPSNPFLPSDFVFRFSKWRRKTSTLFTQKCYSYNASFVSPFSSLLALFLVKLSRQVLLIFIHAQPTFSCVSLPWLRRYHKARWLA